MSSWFDAFPDGHMTIDDLVVEGDKVVARYTLTGTHKGEFMGIPATNKKVTGWVIEIDRVAGGKCVEGWSRMDTLGLMQQLGVVPTPGKGK
jgi:predicted ester cyclase